MRFGTGGETFPLELDAGVLKDADNLMGDFRADAVAGNESYFVGLDVG